MSHSFTTSDGIAIACHRWGESNPGPVVVLHHGFAASAASNWEGTGIVQAFLDAGRSVLAIDARGHGGSDKPHDIAHYGERRMARDLTELLGELGLEQVDLFGYSMGAVVALLMASSGSLARRLVVGGVGEGVLECGGVDTRNVSRDDIAQALLAEGVGDVAHPGAAGFRMFAEYMGNDLKALGAQASAMHCDRIDLAAIAAPTLVLTGVDDVLAVNPQRIADAIGDARCMTFAGDHLGVIRQPGLAASAIEFLKP